MEENVHKFATSNSGRSVYDEYDLKTGKRVTHLTTGPQTRRNFELVRIKPSTVHRNWVDSKAGRWRYPAPYSGTFLQRKVAGDSISLEKLVGSPPAQRVVYSESGYLQPWLNAEFQWPAMPGMNLQNQADVKALNNLKNQDINLGEFFGTFRDTVRTVANGAHSVRRLWLGFRRSKHGREAARRGFRCHEDRCKWYDSYLEMTYGWTPLLQDVYGALEHLARESKAKGLTAHAKGYARDKDMNTYEKDVTFARVASSGFATIGQRVNRSVRTDLWYVLDNPALAELSSLGLVNPVEILWEIVRYSFVVDWFLPIGPWLSSLTGDFGWDFMSGSRTKVLEVEEQVLSARLTEPNAKGSISVPYSAKGFKWKRTVLTSSPVPGFYLKNPLSARHAINAIALLAAAFGR